MKIYNVLGEEVATLISKQLDIGEHTYNFEVNDLSSGIYYYHFMANEFSEVKKMILMR